jgi:hypothetical protein
MMHGQTNTKKEGSWSVLQRLAGKWSMGKLPVFILTATENPTIHLVPKYKFF